MLPQKPTQKAFRLALLAVSTAAVCVTTMVFSIYVPQTRGFFNVGETMVYATALLFGPLIGSFAGGVGSMLADIFLGYWYYAPATLIIKAAEGGIVGLLGVKKPRFNSKQAWKTFTFGAGLTVGVAVAIVGSVYYSGSANLSLGISPAASSMTITIPPELWYGLGALVALLVTVAGFTLEPEFGWPAFTMFAGGAIMVAGYYLYQKLLLFPLFGIGGVVPEAEVPFNIGQMLVGIIVALPLVRIVKRSLPQINSTQNK